MPVVLDGNDFVLEGGNASYGRDLPERWCFDGRAFGGYTASLALAALLRHTERRVAASLSITFLEAGAVGPVELDVEMLRESRTAACARATIHQAGRPILFATSWLADGWDDRPKVEAPNPFGRYGGEIGPLPRPEDAAPVPWLAAEWPTLGFAERRALDYPTSWDEFVRGRPEVALWVRIDAGDAPSAALPHPQLGDVLHADAHLFDAPGQVTGFTDVWLVSLDLTIAWQPGAHEWPATSWRLWEARGSVAPGGVTSFGSLRAEDGSLLAVATSQGLPR